MPIVGTAFAEAELAATRIQASYRGKAAREQQFWSTALQQMTLLDDYAPTAYGAELKSRLLWSVVVLGQDISASGEWATEITNAKGAVRKSCDLYQKYACRPGKGKSCGKSHNCPKILQSGKTCGGHHRGMDCPNN